jgi:hypothetical protein
LSTSLLKKGLKMAGDIVDDWLHNGNFIGTAWNLSTRRRPSSRNASYYVVNNTHEQTKQSSLSAQRHPSALRHTLRLLSALTVITDEKPRYYNKHQQIFSCVLKTNLHIITFLFPMISLNPLWPQSTTFEHSVFMFVFFFQERKPREWEGFLYTFIVGSLVNQSVKPSCGYTRLTEQLYVKNKEISHSSDYSPLRSPWFASHLSLTVSELCRNLQDSVLDSVCVHLLCRNWLQASLNDWLLHGNSWIVPQNREIWSDVTFQYCGPPLQIGLLQIQINMVHVLQSSLYGLLRLPYILVRNFLNSNCRLCCKVLALKHLLVVLLCVMFFLVGIWINFMIKFSSSLSVPNKRTPSNFNVAAPISFSFCSTYFLLRCSAWLTSIYPIHSVGVFWVLILGLGFPD